MKDFFKLKVIIFLLCVFTILLSNYFFFVRFLIATVNGSEEGIFDFTYKTQHDDFFGYEDGGFVKGEEKDFPNVVEKYSTYKKCHPTTPDTILYRTTPMKSWQFWNWLNYFTHPRWQLPYLAPKDVLPKLKFSPPNVCKDSLSIE